ncbi:uncharacterized protein RB166_005620 isoform 1-T1 [Leptodactylus fuscus]
MTNHTATAQPEQMTSLNVTTGLMGEVTVPLSPSTMSALTTQSNKTTEAISRTEVLWIPSTQTSSQPTTRSESSTVVTAMPNHTAAAGDTTVPLTPSTLSVPPAQSSRSTETISSTKTSALPAATSAQRTAMTAIENQTATADQRRIIISVRYSSLLNKPESELLIMLQIAKLLEATFPNQNVSASMKV